MKDSTQVRGTVQALIVWASNNREQYPLPSQLDALNKTVSEEGAAKDTTANILSVLIQNGNISPEICISPAEANTTQIQRKDDYEYSTPSASVVPADALWDPSFRGTPDDPMRAVPGKPAALALGHQSYAHLIPTGDRLELWKDTYGESEAVFGNRGPTYAANDVAIAPAGGRWKLLDGPLGTTSNTLLIHGGRSTWEGNIGYNDNHVNFETSPTPTGVVYERTEAEKKSKHGAADNLFVKEPDEFGGDARAWECGKGLNAYLRPISQMKEGGAVKVWRD